MKPRFHVLALALAVIAVTAFAVTSQAAVIWSNDITGSSANGNPYTLGDSVAAHLTVSGVGAGGGPSSNTGGGRYNFRGWDGGGGYFYWTLTPDTNYEINFTSLTGAWQRSGTGPSSYVLRSSLDSYASVVASGAITGSSSAVNFNLGLGAATFDAVSTPITFRLYATGAGGSSGTFSINDFVFNGDIVESIVPEPASLGLLGLGTLLLARRRKA